MPVYWGDLTVDTMHLSPAAHGGYMRLIAHYWAKGGPPSNATFCLKQICGMSSEEWEKCRPEIAEFFDIKDGKWFHKRIEKELQLFENKYKKRSEAGRKGGLTRASNARILLEAKLNQPEPEPTTSSLRSEVSSLRSESSVFEKPTRARKRKPSNSRIEYPPDFERFWRGYPTDSNMSKAEALREWEKLDAVDREAAERSLAAFRAYCSKNPDYRPVHAIRYLKLRRFDGHISTNGHDGTSPARSEKEAMMSWAMEHHGFSQEQAEARWEWILQRRQASE
jgi:uncharacterized protein YdaU (DUF1376 family)